MKLRKMNWSVYQVVTLVILTLVFLTPTVRCSRRNSKFARNWERLDRLHPKTTIKRHIVQRTRLKNSPIHYIRMPAVPYSRVSITGRVRPGHENLNTPPTVAMDNTEKVTDEKKKLTGLNLAELPKTGAGVLLLQGRNSEKIPPENSLLKLLTKPSKYSSRYSSLYKNSNILKPKIPFLINGKPHKPYTLKNQLEKYKKKKKKDRLKIQSNEIKPDIRFSANGKPTRVYNLNDSQPDTQTHLMPFDLKSKNRTISRLSQPSKNYEMSTEKLTVTKTTTAKPRVKLKPSNSPIYTFKLPPNLNLNSLRSILGNIKTNHIHHKNIVIDETTTTTKRSTTISAPSTTTFTTPTITTTTITTTTITTTTTSTTTTIPTTTTITTTTTTIPTTTTITTTTTTATTSTTPVKTTETISNLKKLTPSKVFTYKMPPFISASSFKKFLIGYGVAKKKKSSKNPFSLTKFIKGVSQNIFSKGKTTTVTTTSTTTTKTTTTTRKTSVLTSNRRNSSPITWLKGKLTGIPSKLFHFRPPFSILSWFNGLNSSQQHSENILRVKF